MARIEKPLFFGKTLRQFCAAVRVDVVFVRVNRQSADLEICGDIGGGINNIDVGVFGCQFPDAGIGFQGAFVSGRSVWRQPGMREDKI